MASKSSEPSPAMKQFWSAKAKYPDALLFFRMGDFYELFFDDAKVGAAALGLTLTSRSKSADGEEIPMAGVPHHACGTYLSRLLQQGFKVAICEQMADPKTVKGIVPREVVQVLSPALVVDDLAVEPGTEALLAALERNGDGFVLITYDHARHSELSRTDLASESGLLAELLRQRPRELLWADAACASDLALQESIKRVLPSARCEDVSSTTHPLRAQIDGPLSSAITAIVSYIERARPLSAPERYVLRNVQLEQHLILAGSAITSLELVSRMDGSYAGSLLSMLDETRSCLGKRELRRRLLIPTRDRNEIARRHDAVAQLLDESRRRDIRAHLSGVYDIERILTRLRERSANSDELVRLATSLRNGSLGLEGMRTVAKAVADVLARLEQALVLEDASEGRETGDVRDGVDPELDRARNLVRNAEEVLLRVEEKERKASGINTLKVKYTRVFGYYFEISKANAHLAPNHFIRKQTVANGERFTTPELDEVENELSRANELLLTRQAAIIDDLAKVVAAHEVSLRAFANEVADLDVCQGLAECAARNRYVRPSFVDGADACIRLKNSRHPTVELLRTKTGFVRNDVTIGGDQATARWLVITGPNMAGKSTIMRQTALAIVMAQMGSFVAADSAELSLFDKIYTRVGASDNLTEGHSTFMLEMKETAEIVAGVTPRTFAILDEVGRGTSTVDGLAIAWAVAHHLATQTQALGMFATHYHELSALAAECPTVANYTIAVAEEGEELVLLHRFVPGASNRSFGLQVARRAGLPTAILEEAKQRFERGQPTESEPKQSDVRDPKRDPVRLRIQALDIDELRPLDALVVLSELKKLAALM